MSPRQPRSLRLMEKRTLDLAKKTKKEVRQGKQTTLDQWIGAPGPEDMKTRTPEEAEMLQNQRLAKEWEVPVENIRTYSWALAPVTTYQAKN